jgi:putative MATE family efflux protein
MGADPALIPMIRDYIGIWYMGAVFVTLPLVGNAAIRASGDTMTPAVIMTVAAVVNVILDPLLIFGLAGFPRLEIQGAAISTVLANAAAALAGLYILYAKKHLLCLKYLTNLSNFGNSSKRLLVIALPAGLTNSIQPLVNALIITLLAKTGVEAVAAYGIVSRIEAFAFIVIMGVAVAMAPIIGQNFGAKRMTRVHETLRLAIQFSVLYSVTVAVVLFLFGRTIVGLFDDNELVIGYALLFIWIVPCTYAFSNLVHGWGSAFNAMGMPQWSFVMVVIKMIVLMVPAVMVGHYFYDITGLFVAIALVNLFAGIGFHFWSRKILKAKTNQLG